MPFQKVRSGAHIQQPRFRALQKCKENIMQRKERNLCANN